MSLRDNDDDDDDDDVKTNQKFYSNLSISSQFQWDILKWLLDNLRDFVIIIFNIIKIFTPYVIVMMINAFIITFDDVFEKIELLII